MSVKNVSMQLTPQLERGYRLQGHKRSTLAHVSLPTYPTLKRQKITIPYKYWFKSNDKNNREPITIQTHIFCTFIIRLIAGNLIAIFY